ncbi:hypothetical protein GCM10020000_03710 [Streptomyces olivoverticillatus]
MASTAVAARTLLLAVTVATADTGDRVAAQCLIAQVADAHHLLELDRADGNHTGGPIEYCFTALRIPDRVKLTPSPRPRHRPRRELFPQRPLTTSCAHSQAQPPTSTTRAPRHAHIQSVDDVHHDPGERNPKGCGSSMRSVSRSAAAKRSPLKKAAYAASALGVHLRR